MGVGSKVELSFDQSNPTMIKQVLAQAHFTKGTSTCTNVEVYGHGFRRGWSEGPRQSGGSLIASRTCPEGLNSWSSSLHIIRGTTSQSQVCNVQAKVVPNYRGGHPSSHHHLDPSISPLRGRFCGISRLLYFTIL